MSGSLSRRRSGRRGGRVRRSLADINVTPFVDVMLVLLIVFMVTAPLLTAGIQVNLPRTAAKSLPSQQDPLTVTVLRNGDIFLQETAISLPELKTRMSAILAEGYDAPIYVRGEDKAFYDSMTEVIAALQSAGVTRISLVTEPVASR
jgi:biopolymer transport protein TolR